jgi:hypothetical protein
MEMTGKFTVDGGHIAVPVVAGLTKAELTALYDMRGFKANVTEPDRGAKRNPIEGVYCSIGDVRIPKKSRDATVTERLRTVLTFPDDETSMEALNQIRECDPPTLTLTKSQIEISDEDDEEGEVGEDELPGI